MKIRTGRDEDPHRERDEDPHREQDEDPNRKRDEDPHREPDMKIPTWNEMKIHTLASYFANTFIPDTLFPTDFRFVYIMHA